MTTANHETDVPRVRTVPTKDAEAPVRPGGGPTTLPATVRYFARHASPRILAASVTIALVARLVVADFQLVDLVPIGIILLWWPISEWLTHVFVLHAKPFEIGGRRFDPAVSRKHRAHHRDPWNLEILFIPLQSFFFTLPLITYLCFALTPTTALALTALSTYLVLSLRYEWIHFIAHSSYSPRMKNAQRLIRAHRLHHFKNENYWYGVSMTAADVPLRTSPSPEDVESSETCRTLGYAA